MTTSELERMYVASARELFRNLRERIPALSRRASAQNVSDIECLEDLPKVLFPHTVYKSYPLSQFEQIDFGRLTRWLSDLTTVDLSALETRRIETIDQWIQALDASTELRIVHSFGTTGKLSFIPRTRQEWRLGAQLIVDSIDGRAAGRHVASALQSGSMPIVQPFYRHGASAAIRGSQTFMELFGGGEANSLFLYPSLRFSADVACFASRLARSDAADLPLPSSTALTEAFRRFAAEARDRPRHLQEFFEKARRMFGGRDVYLFGVWPTLYAWAEAGLSRGIRSVFGPGSILHTGGGTKGVTLPEGWQERIFEFLGSRDAYEFYAMTELIPACLRCRTGNYHVPPVLVPMVLDEVGRLMPRSGISSGRLAFLDLLATTYWGGFITGDYGSLAGWDALCPCGRSGPYLLSNIRRIAKAEGGDDKINCSGVAVSYDQALERLARTYQ